MITLTDNAAAKVKELIDAEGDDELALRVAVRPGGCSGFSYEMFFDTDVADDDLTVEYGGVKVVVDPSSAQLLTGATLDYKDGLRASGSRSTTPTRSAPAAAASPSAEPSPRAVGAGRRLRGTRRHLDLWSTVRSTDHVTSAGHVTSAVR